MRNVRIYDIIFSHDEQSLLVLGHTAMVQPPEWNAGFQDVYVIKINASNVIEWEYTFSLNEHNLPEKLERSFDGNYLFSANTRKAVGNDEVVYVKVKIDDNGEVIWEKELKAYDFYPTKDNGFVFLTGETILKTNSKLEIN